MFQTLSGYIGTAIILLVGILAFSLGGKAERVGAGAYILGWIATVFVSQLTDIYGVQWGMLMVDSAVLAVFGVLIWRSHLPWPVWACAFQLLTVASHCMLIFRIPTPLSAFYMIVNLMGYGILLALAAGTIWAWQERKALSIDDLDEFDELRA